MIPIPAARLADLLAGVLEGDVASPISGWALDHRQVKPGDAFVGIKGANFDGHSVAAEAVAAGAAVVVAEREVDAPHILVDDLVKALARMALAYREAFTGDVIAVTGSAGKTTTKELIAAALGTSGMVLKTTGNRNTEYTAPLLWTDLLPEHKFVVVEMAMRGPGQIAHLAEFSKPTIGLVTNIGYSHIELLGSREAIANAKGALLAALEPSGHAAVWDEDPFRSTLESLSSAPVLHFGFASGSACQIETYEPLGLSGSRISGTCMGEPWSAVLSTPGKHLALNAAAAVLVARLAGVEAGVAGEALASAELPAMRMEVREVNGITILLDAYNASPASMVAALETLADAEVSGSKFAVIGDMRELGSYAEAAHKELASVLVKSGLSGAIAVGEWAPLICSEMLALGFGGDVIAVADAADAKPVLADWAKPGDAVLIKGSRSLKLEDVLPE